MDGIGANEYLVDVAHGACDFISTVDTPSIWELNIWYHTLNCGYRCRISGETDFPVHLWRAVGLGRSYVHLDGKLNFDDWVEGIKKGRCYVSDGKSHLLDFTVNGLGVGLKKSEVRPAKPGTVKVKAKVAALLEPMPTPRPKKSARPAADKGNRAQTLTSKPYWDVERARIGNTRKVPVEVVVNGFAVIQGNRRRRHRARGNFRRADQAIELGLPADFSVEPYQPGVCPGGRQADPDEQEVGRMVPEGDRPLLGEQEAKDSAQGTARGRGRLQQGTCGVQENLGGKCRMICRLQLRKEGLRP